VRAVHASQAVIGNDGTCLLFICTDVHTEACVSSASNPQFQTTLSNRPILVMLAFTVLALRVACVYVASPLST